MRQRVMGIGRPPGAMKLCSPLDVTTSSPWVRHGLRRGVRKREEEGSSLVLWGKDMRV